MRKHRSNDSTAITPGRAFKAFLLCLVIGGGAVVFVWQKQQIEQLGTQIRAKEARVEKLRENNLTLRGQLAVMQSTERLEAMVKEMKLDLHQVDPLQVKRLPEPAAEPPRPAPRQFAASPAPPITQGVIAAATAK